MKLIDSDGKYRLFVFPDSSSTLPKVLAAMHSWVVYAAALLAAVACAAAQQNFTLPKLPYIYNAMEPVIDSLTQETHWTK